MQIPEVPLIPSPQTDEARKAVGYKWAGPVAGRRHKIGGSPDWLQKPEIPVCPSCRQPMPFYGQLDSLGDSVDLADCGMGLCFCLPRLLHDPKCAASGVKVVSAPNKQLQLTVGHRVPKQERQHAAAELRR